MDQKQAKRKNTLKKYKQLVTAWEKIFWDKT